jgi:hypothetical protein
MHHQCCRLKKNSDDESKTKKMTAMKDIEVVLRMVWG